MKTNTSTQATENDLTVAFDAATGGLTVEAAEGVTLTTGDAYTLTFSLTAEDGTELTAFTLDVTIS